MQLDLQPDASPADCTATASVLLFGSSLDMPSVIVLPVGPGSLDQRLGAGMLSFGSGSASQPFWNTGLA